MKITELPWDEILIEGTPEELARVERVLSLTCCALAVVRPCVCDIHTTCPTHGEKHHGTHD